MDYLVTGGCGFIGSTLVDSLIETGHTVRILDDLSSGTLTYKPRDVELVRGDVADPEIVARAMQDMDGCFHLAAVASVERGNLEWLGTHKSNQTGSITIFDAARRVREPPIPVVFASSAAVYGDNASIPLAETDATRPVSAYGADKLGSELHGRVAHLIHGVPNRGMRFFNVYGPRQDPKSPYSGVITIFMRRMRDKLPITINGDGYHSRDFVYVGDVVRALQAAMQHCTHVGGHDVFNVCTGRDTNIIDIADELSLLIGRTKIIHGPARPGDPRTSLGDPAKAERLLGFRATTDLGFGLAQTVAPDHGGWRSAALVENERATQ